MQVRRKRFEAMDSAFARYERGTELNEGLATYVERFALWRSAEFPSDEFDAEAVRQRVYTVGPALAFLLDRFLVDWKELLEKDDRQYLDQMLVTALESNASAGAPVCAFSPRELSDIEARAKKDAAAVVEKRLVRRRQFDSEPGWRVIIETSAKRPLWPEQFDPLNLERVEGGLLHTRWLRLKNDHGDLEALDGADADITVLTEGAGPHPLFNGVKRVVVLVGAKPDVNIWGENRVAVEAPGFRISVEDAAMHQDESAVWVRLGK
jgi:hypothetical protein